MLTVPVHLLPWFIWGNPFDPIELSAFIAPFVSISKMFLALIPWNLSFDINLKLQMWCCNRRMRSAIAVFLAQPEHFVMMCACHADWEEEHVIFHCSRYDSFLYTLGLNEIARNKYCVIPHRSMYSTNRLNVFWYLLLALSLPKKFYCWCRFHEGIVSKRDQNTQKYWFECF